MAPVTNFYLSKILLIFAMISFSQGRIFLNPSQQFTHPRSPATQGMYKNLLENCRKKNLLFYLIKSFIPVRQFKIHPMPSYKPADSLGSLCRNIYKHIPNVQNQEWFQNICQGKKHTKKRNSIF